MAQAFASRRPAIEQALFEHYEPYAEAVTAGELPSPSEALWPAPGSEDTELGVWMELEVGHGETEVYPRVQA